MAEMQMDQNYGQCLACGAAPITHRLTLATLAGEVLDSVHYCEECMRAAAVDAGLVLPQPREGK